MKRNWTVGIFSPLALVIHAAPAAQAQSSRGTVDQIGSSQPVGILQLSRGSVHMPSPQLSSSAESASPARQLTAERGSGPAAQQLTRLPRSAQPSIPLSRPEDGRTAAVERVAGSDRCDPAKNVSRTAKCAHVIENRAGEFTRRDTTPLSPEQRIVMEQQLRERSAGLSSAARRLAANGDDAWSMEAQGVASVVLGAPSGEPKRDKSDDDPAASEQMKAIVNAIVNQPAPQ